jgi:hypothetical protein
MKSTLILGLLALLLWEAESHAQNNPTEGLSKTALPAGTVAVHKKIAPEAAHWTTQTFSIPLRDYSRKALVELADKTMQGAIPPQPPHEAGVAPVPIRRETTRRFQLIRSDLTLNDGSRLEAWTLNGSTLVLDRTRNGVYRLGGSSEVPEIPGIIKNYDFKETDFPELAWIWGQRAAAKVVLHDQKFWVFEKRIPTPDGLEAAGGEKHLFAIVSQQTGLPVFTFDGLQCCIYSYGSPPSSLILPADVQDELTKWVQEIATINAAPPRYP